MSHPTTSRQAVIQVAGDALSVEFLPSHCRGHRLCCPRAEPGSRPVTQGIAIQSILLRLDVPADPANGTCWRPSTSRSVARNRKRRRKVWPNEPSRFAATSSRDGWEAVQSRTRGSPVARFFLLEQAELCGRRWTRQRTHGRFVAGQRRQRSRRQPAHRFNQVTKLSSCPPPCRMS
jgi:hypothetical protein